MVRYLLSLFLLTVTLPLFAQVKSLTLQDGKTYTLDKAGATYTVTSNGSPVNAQFIITASTKLILDNCHILRTDEGAPITISASGVTLEIQIKNTNTICTNNASGATSVISSEKINAPTLIFSEAPNAPASSELLLRGSSTATANTPPVQLNKGGSIVFRNGTVRIATSEKKNDTNLDWIPSLASADTITLHGSTVIAQMCPRDGLGIGYSDFSAYPNTVNQLFTCNTFNPCGGILTTKGETCNKLGEVLKYTISPYDTYYAYYATPMEIKKIIPVTVSPQITGGIIRTSSKFHCYGLPPNTTYLKGSFIDNSGNLFGGKSNEDGVLSLAYSPSYEGLRFNLDAKAEALVKVFNATPMPTANGCKAEAQFGISHITIDAESLQTVLHLTLNLINDPSTVEEKTVYVRIFCEVDAEERVMIAEQPFVFTRDSSGAPIFTATFTDTTQARAASRTVRYTIEAYN